MKLNILRTFLLIGLAVFSPLLIYISFTGTGLGPQIDLVSRVFLGLLFLLTFGYIWLLLITRICKIEVTNNTIISINYITQVQIEISVSEVYKIELSFWNNTFDFIDKEGVKLLRIDKDGYRNIGGFISIIENKMDKIK